MTSLTTIFGPSGFDATKSPTFEPSTPPEFGFSDALHAFGMEVDGPIIPGEIQRCRMADQKRGNKRNGWYLYFGSDPGTGIAAGVFGDWRHDQRQYWSSVSERDMDARQQAAYQAHIKAMQAVADRERQARQDEAAQEAASIINSAPLAASHDYLTRKQVKPYGLYTHEGALIIPMRNAQGDIRSLQRIYPNGDKRFLAGGQTRGCFHLIGSTLTEPTYLVEGYATGATIHTLTGKSVVVAFTSGNLGHTIEAIRSVGNHNKIIVAADNDRHTDGNPGITAASKAAEGHLGVHVVYPEFQGSEGTDFNDLAVGEGDDAVRHCLNTVPPIKESASLVGIDEMMALASQSLPWLIKPFFYLDSTVCIFGPPKQFKTFVALDMALSIATGLPFMGKWEVRRPGMVIYVAGEGVFGVSHRVRAWALSKGIPDEEFTTENVPFYRTKGSIPISDGGADEMARQCQELSDQAGLPINAIIIDTVARNFGSGNESDTKDMNQFINRCDTDIKERFGCCTVLVHHTGHNERDRPRGSMVLPGAMDGLIRVTAEEDSKLIEVAPLFYKDSETPDGFLAQPNKVDLGYVDEDGEPIESIALAWMGQGIIDAQERYSPDEKLLLSLVSDEPKPSMILRDDFIHEAMKMPVQKGKNKGEKRNNRACSVAYGRAFNKLLEKGLLQQCDSGIVAGNFYEKQ